MSAHGDKATEILSDGEWHDGIELLREVEKVLLPGPAHRQNEADRVRSAVRRHGETRERVREVDLGRTVDFGKRSLLRKLVNDRHRQGTWEIRPWPIPRGGWRSGGWEIRDVNATRVSLSRAMTDLGIVASMGDIRALLAQDPPLPISHAGRRTYVEKSAIPELSDRYKRWRAGQSPRRCSHCKRQLRDYVVWKRLSLCHPQSGMDCYLLVKDLGHGPECRGCMSLVQLSTSGG